MYHYTECGLQKVWLENGYSVKKGLAAMVGVTEQNVSLWERQGKIPRYASRLVKLMQRLSKKLRAASVYRVSSCLAY